MTAGWCAGIRHVWWLDCVGFVFFCFFFQFRSATQIGFKAAAVSGSESVLRLQLKNDKGSYFCTYNHFLHLAASFSAL